MDLAGGSCFGAYRLETSQGGGFGFVWNLARFWVTIIGGGEFEHKTGEGFSFFSFLGIDINSQYIV